MVAGTRLTTVDRVHEDGSWLFTVRDRHGALDEVLLVPCGDGVEGWVNRCTHEAQRLDRGVGAVLRDGEIVCPRHGSMFDACSGRCGNGEAAGTILLGVDIAVVDGDVFLVDRDVSYEHDGDIDDGSIDSGGIDSGGIDSGGIDDGDGDDGDDDPASTSHIGF